MTPGHPHSASLARGVASVEAVVFIPFLLMVYFGVTLVHGRYDAAQRAWISARSCAWMYSQRACQGELPAECGAANVEPSELPENSDLNDATSSNQIRTDDAASNKVHTTLGAPSRTLFGEYTTVTGSADFQAPTVFGGSRRISAKYFVACNLEPQTLGDIARDLVEAVMP